MGALQQLLSTHTMTMARLHVLGTSASALSARGQAAAAAVIRLLQAAAAPDTTSLLEGAVAAAGAIVAFAALLEGQVAGVSLSGLGALAARLQAAAGSGTAAATSMLASASVADQSLQADMINLVDHAVRCLALLGSDDAALRLDLPRKSEAERRLTFYVNSLYMRSMPVAVGGPLAAPSLAPLTPHFAETVTFAKVRSPACCRPQKHKSHHHQCRLLLAPSLT